jgi:hypothetical protein
MQQVIQYHQANLNNTVATFAEMSAVKTNLLHTLGDLQPRNVRVATMPVAGNAGVSTYPRPLAPTRTPQTAPVPQNNEANTGPKTLPEGLWVLQPLEDFVWWLRYDSPEILRLAIFLTVLYAWEDRERIQEVVVYLWP